MARELSGLRVAIVGAGLAGLTAARELRRRGAEPILFDARDRVGGRVWTCREFADGRHAELGADLIEEEQERVLELAKAVGCTPVRILRGGFGFHAEGDSGMSRHIPAGRSSRSGCSRSSTRTDWPSNAGTRRSRAAWHRSPRRHGSRASTRPPSNGRC